MKLKRVKVDVTQEDIDTGRKWLLQKFSILIFHWSV